MDFNLSASGSEPILAFVRPLTARDRRACEQFARESAEQGRLIRSVLSEWAK